jgi:hypothetical protein
MGILTMKPYEIEPIGDLKFGPVKFISFSYVFLLISNFVSFSFGLEKIEHKYCRTHVSRDEIILLDLQLIIA